MRRVSSFFLLILSLISFGSSPIQAIQASLRAESKRPIALVFGGAGTENDDPTGTLLSAVKVAEKAGFQAVIVTDLLNEEDLKHASVWIQPGGPNFSQAQDMQLSGVFEQVKRFVAGGGGYVGFCGGAFMAQSYGSYGLGLLPGMADRHKELTGKVEVIWGRKKRFLHFEHGPSFETGPGVEVFATYVRGGDPAAIRGHYGHGRVFLSGPHPEAQEDWEPIVDPDGLDADLAVEMIHWAARRHRSSHSF